MSGRGRMAMGHTHDAHAFNCQLARAGLPISRMKTSLVQLAAYPTAVTPDSVAVWLWIPTVELCNWDLRSSAATPAQDRMTTHRNCKRLWTLPIIELRVA